VLTIATLQAQYYALKEHIHKDRWREPKRQPNPRFPKQRIHNSSMQSSTRSRSSPQQCPCSILKLWQAEGHGNGRAARTSSRTTRIS